MFKLKKPCKDCPFRQEGSMIESLGEGRIEEIITSVIHEDGFFSCHKTVNYEKLEEEGRVDVTETQFCAGALIALEKANATLNNRNTRMAIGFGMYNPDELQDKDSVIEPSDYLKNSKENCYE